MSLCRSAATLEGMTTRSRLRVATTSAVLSVVLAVLAGCDGGDSDAGIASAGGTAAPSASAAVAGDGLKFAACMRANGIDMPDPDPSSGGGGLRSLRTQNIDQAKLSAALAKCQQYRPNGGQGNQADPQRQQQLEALAKCMRDHGVDVPDPDPNTGFRGMTGQLQALQSDPDWNAAMTACQSLMPAGATR
jgi:hypothetical protein